MRAAGLRPGRHSFLMVADLARRPADADAAGRVLASRAFDPEAAEELRQAHNAAFADYPDRADASADFWTMFMVTARPRPARALGDRPRRRRCGGGLRLRPRVRRTALGRAGPEVHVPYVGTLPAHRGRGLATGLLAAVLHRARGAGYVTASLNVDTDNPTGALGIYERAGFRQLYRQDSYHLDESRAVGDRLSR